MKKIILLVAVALITASCGSTKNSSKGWVSLFDGKTLNGWHEYGKTVAGSAWKAQDGVLFLDAASVKTGAKGGDIVTDEVYENFHLKLEWKISPKGNSGIMWGVQEDPAKFRRTYQTGPEMQIIDNDGHADAKITKHRAGDLYDLVKSSSETVKAVGEWNEVEIISNNGKLDLKLNGVTVVSTTMWDDNWKELIAKSKFATWQGFGAFRSGKIALQDHGNDVWFRNIKIKRL